MASEPSPSTPPYDGPRQSPEDVLPPVEPPSAGFILQLFFIPLLIVSLVVLVWLLFSWIAQAGNDPRDLVQNLKRLNDSSWQSALSLAEQLKNSEYDELKDDHELCHDLADILSSELREGSVVEARLHLRIFICRALGEFRVDDGLEALLTAAEQQRQPQEIIVRAAAIEALAVMANSPANSKIRDDRRLFDAFLKASQERAEADDPNHLADELRSRAAYALGILGSEDARNRLVVLLDDAYPNVRYNAATGLARQGDWRSVGALVEMLDASNDRLWVDEKSTGEKERKRAQVLLNGVRGAYQLLEHPAPTHDSDGDRTALREALEKLRSAADYPNAQAAALEALRRIDE